MSHLTITTGEGYCYKTRNGLKICNLQVEQRTGMLFATLDGEYKIYWTPTGYYDVHMISPYDIVEQERDVKSA